MGVVDLLEENIGKKYISVNEDMAKHTTFKTGGKADIFIKVDSVEKLTCALKICKEHNIPIFILRKWKQYFSY